MYIICIQISLVFLPNNSYINLQNCNIKFCALSFILEDITSILRAASPARSTSEFSDMNPVHQPSFNLTSSRGCHLPKYIVDSRSNGRGLSLAGKHFIEIATIDKPPCFLSYCFHKPYLCLINIDYPLLHGLAIFRNLCQSLFTPNIV